MVTLSLPVGMSSVDQFEACLQWALKVNPEFYFRDDCYGLGSMIEIVMEAPPRRLEKFCFDVEHNEQISPETLEWLAAAGRQYLAGESTLALALGLEEPKKPGRPPEKKVGAAGLRMFALKHLDNEKYEVALLRVMGESKIPERSIQRAYGLWRDYAANCGWCQKAE